VAIGGFIVAVGSFCAVSETTRVLFDDAVEDDNGAIVDDVDAIVVVDDVVEWEGSSR
jgi:hypothetical protein